MNGSRIPVWLYLFLVFAGGLGVGAFGDRLYTAKTVRADTREAGPRTPEDYRKRYIDELKKRLYLSPDQVTKLTAILEATQARMHALHERDRPEMAAIHQEQVDRVHAILDDKQDSEYDKMREEREKRRAAEKR
jgi:hypothetical protein